MLARPHPVLLALRRVFGWHHARPSRRRVATIFAVLLAVALGYHVIFSQNGLTAYRQKRQNNVLLAKEIEELNDENSLLKSHVERLRTDPSSIEHEAREELHYTRPGEVIYTLPETPRK